MPRNLFDFEFSREQKRLKKAIADAARNHRKRSHLVAELRDLVTSKLKDELSPARRQNRRKAA